MTAGAPVTIPRALLERLAPPVPLTDGEFGYCVHCERGLHPSHAHGMAGRHLADHEPDCPWLQARGLLGDNI